VNYKPYICCSNQNFTKQWDLEHASGLDFDLFLCCNCKKYTMNLWTPHGSEECGSTFLVEVKEEDASDLINLHQRKMAVVHLYESGKKEESEKYFMSFWAAFKKELETWLSKSGFDW
jgi:hypothetical protein